ncbi:DUF3820 family protein [Roseibacillus ishigakijimensis]|nr:DUF3820 family protein [Roseibacillus ishigakijimensis]
MMEFGDIDQEEWRQIYEDLCVYRMPFGRYQDRLLVSLPDEYLMWFQRQGFPTGRLGELMAFVYEVKMAGAEEVFVPILRRERRGS